MVASLGVAWSNEWAVGQSPAGKNAGTEAEDIVGIRHQVTIGETRQAEKT
jgi:hypothetical protein